MTDVYQIRIKGTESKDIESKDTGHRLVFAPTRIGMSQALELMAAQNIQADKVTILDSGQSFSQLAEQIGEINSTASEGERSHG